MHGNWIAGANAKPRKDVAEFRRVSFTVSCKIAWIRIRQFDGKYRCRVLEEGARVASPQGTSRLGYVTVFPFLRRDRSSGFSPWMSPTRIRQKTRFQADNEHSEGESIQHK